MSERLSGGGAPGRRRAQTGDALSGPADAGDSGDARDAPDAGVLESVLATAIRADDLAPDAEQRAVAAFRAAHSAGVQPARTRRRDDWRRPAEKRRSRRTVKLTFGVAFAGLALGGVAVAAVCSVGSSTHGTGTGRGTAHPSAVAPDRPGDAGSSPSSSAGGGRPTDRPVTAQDTAAHCRAYEQVQGHGKALDSTAWQRLVAAAGGEDKVAAYCSEQLTGTGKSAKSTANSANGSQGDTGASAKSTPGNGQANGGQGNGKDK